VGEAAPAREDKASPRKSRTLAIVAVFSALIALGTILSIPLPPPLYEITWAPPIYLALAVLVDSATAFDATAMGGFIGEAFNVAFRGGGSPIYPFGMVWARGPEVFIVAWAKRRGTKTLVIAMVAATVFETLAFFFSDWAFYNYGLFGYVCQTASGAQCASVYDSYGLASADFFTLVDIAFIPVALALIRAAKPYFRRLGFE
jgi:hypothetical protein